MRSIERTSDFTIDKPIGDLFPLFTPEGEKLWVPGWAYVNVTGSTKLHDDYVFLTKSHDHSSADAIWIVKRYDPEKYLAQYYRVEPGEKVGTVTVRCERTDDNSTRVEVTYKYVGLSESGNKFIESYSEETHGRYIAEWKTLLEKYFEKI